MVRAAIVNHGYLNPISVDDMRSVNLLHEFLIAFYFVLNIYHSSFGNADLIKNYSSKTSVLWKVLEARRWFRYYIGLHFYKCYFMSVSNSTQIPSPWILWSPRFLCFLLGPEVFSKPILQNSIFVIFYWNMPVSLGF